jgi:hypothetical protein
MLKHLDALFYFADFGLEGFDIGGRPGRNSQLVSQLTFDSVKLPAVLGQRCGIPIDLAPELSLACDVINRPARPANIATIRDTRYCDRSSRHLNNAPETFKDTSALPTDKLFASFLYQLLCHYQKEFVFCSMSTWNIELAQN